MIADSTGETAARVARVVQTQFPGEAFRLIRHPRITGLRGLFEIFEGMRGTPGRRVILYTLVDEQLRELVRMACQEMEVPHADLLGDAIAAFEQATGREADEVMRRPVGVEADYFVRISAMEFAIRNDDGAMPESLRECDICLVGASRSGKTPLSIYLGYLGYKVVNVPLVPGIEPPANCSDWTGGGSSGSPSTPSGCSRSATAGCAGSAASAPRTATPTSPRSTTNWRRSGGSSASWGAR